MVIAALGLAAALGTVLARNLVHAALYLVAFFFTVACQFVLLEAEFLAALQVLVYIGAVAILLMFGIMLTRNIQGDDPTQHAVGLEGARAGRRAVRLPGARLRDRRSEGDRRLSTRGRRPRPGPRIDAAKRTQPPSAARAAVNNMAKVVGDELMTRYVIAFEVAGLLLTAALVGAIADRPSRGGRAGGSRAARRSCDEPSRAAQRRGSTATCAVGAAAPRH